MGDIFSTGITGLNAAQTALNTIAQNVSNANTPGYARQVIQTTTQSPSKIGGGFSGNGVMVSGIASLVDPFLEAQLTAAVGSSGMSSQMSSLFSQLQSIVGDSASGISTNSANFQSALGQAATSPSSLPARQLVLASATTLSNAINTAAAQMNNQKQAAAQSLNADVNQANLYLKQIASLNDTIAKSEPRDASGNVLEGQKANDLRNQRQTVVDQLAKLTNVSVVEQNEGINVMIGGAAVVVSNHFSTLATLQDPLDPTKLAVGISTPGGVANLGANTVGGKIGGTLLYIDNGLDQSAAQLNQYAALISQAANDQSAKGADAYGQTGSPLFTQSAPTANANSANTGTLTLTATVNLYQTQPSQYKLTYATASGYQLTRLSDGKTVASGGALPLAADGLTIAASSGTIANGDSFLIDPFGSQSTSMKVAIADPKQLALASPVATAANPANASKATIANPTVVSGLPLNANLTQPVSITFTSATQYTISGTGIGVLTNQPYVAGQAISYNGWSTSINGVPAIGDSFAIKASNGAQGDGSNANALNAILQSKSFVGGTETLAEVYASMQSDVGNKASVAMSQAASDTSVLGIATSQRESYSGVNLDQEAADLARWQQIYAANAQVMSIAQKLFSDLIAKLG